MTFMPKIKQPIDRRSFVIGSAAGGEERLRLGGQAIFETRAGQLNIACAQCHDDNWGRRLAGHLVPQAQPTGYPVYRLQWQEVGSLQRRLRDCMTAMRAEPYDYGSPQLVDLEFYLMWRARGLKTEAPAVRP